MSTQRGGLGVQSGSMKGNCSELKSFKADQDVEGARRALDAEDPQGWAPDLHQLPDVVYVCLNHSLIGCEHPDKGEALHGQGVLRGL